MREMGLARPLDIGQLRLHLERRSGMSITLRAEPDLLGAQVYGYTTKDPANRQIVVGYEARAARVHQTMIILHEFAHLILDHPGQAIDHSYRAGHEDEFQEISVDTISRVLATGPPPHRSRKPRRRGRMGRRSLYDDPLEWEAETMATIMFGWTADGGRDIREVPRDPFEDALGWI
jgi:hypothetical protein